MAVDDSVPRTVSRAPRASLIYDPTFRAIVFQVLIAAALIAFVAWIADNTITNLRRANIASGFAFLGKRSGFDVAQSLIPYSAESTYGRALVVGLLNTILIAVLGIIFASIIGFLLGIARLSGNWLLSRLAAVYVETFRNIPVLLQLLFWYKAVLSVLPSPRQGYWLPFGSNLSNRGLFMPRPLVAPEFVDTGIAFLVAIAAVFVLARWARRRQLATGRLFPTFRTSVAILLGLPIIVFLATGAPLAFEFPALTAR